MSDPNQSPLFLDSIYEALSALVRASGGPKEVGSQLWPSKDPEAAGKLLNDCLNPGRNDKLDLEQFLHLLRIGRDAGFHQTKHWLDADTGYTPSEPADPDEQEAQTVAALERATDTMRRSLEMLDRIRGQRKSRR